MYSITPIIELIARSFAFSEKKLLKFEIIFVSLVTHFRQVKHTLKLFLFLSYVNYAGEPSLAKL